MAALENPALYQVDPETIWTKLRPRTNNRRMLGVLRAAVAWREREVQRINIPRQRLVKDECLLEIAATMPRTADDLMRIRGMVRSFTEGYAGGQLLKVIEAARRLPQDALPLPPDKHSPRPSPALVALLKVLLATKSELHDVAQKLIASADDIDRLASEENPDIPPLHGWRLEVFGHDALALKAGKLLLGVAGRHVKLQTVRVGT
jgi:ribonuclease D